MVISSKMTLIPLEKTNFGCWRGYFGRFLKNDQNTPILTIAGWDGLNLSKLIPL